MNIYFIKHNNVAETVFTWQQAYKLYAEKVSALNIEHFAEWTDAQDMNLTAKHGETVVELICLLNN
jgi:hypothetical protein